MNVNAVKAMLYRRFILHRKTIFALIGGTFLFMIFGWLTLLSMKIGNFRYAFETTAERDSAMTNLSLLFTFMVPLMLSMAGDDNPIFAMDLKCRWKEYAKSSTVIWLDDCISRFIFLVLTLSVAFVLSIVNTLVINSMTGAAFTMSSINYIFVCLDAFLVLKLIIDPFKIMAKSEKYLNLSDVSVGVLFVALILVLSRKIIDFGKSLGDVDNIDSIITSLLGKADKYFAYNIPLFFGLFALLVIVDLIAARKEAQG